jgi:hypothetical protein
MYTVIQIKTNDRQRRKRFEFGGKKNCYKSKKKIESENTITDISRLLNRPQSTVSSFIRRFLLWG